MLDYLSLVPVLKDYTFEAHLVTALATAFAGKAVTKAVTV
jgi:hypothetical protein